MLKIKKVLAACFITLNVMGMKAIKTNNELNVEAQSFRNLAADDLSESTILHFTFQALDCSRINLEEAMALNDKGFEWENYGENDETIHRADRFWRELKDLIKIERRQVRKTSLSRECLLQPSRSIRKLKCGHAYHRDCLMGIINHGKKCVFMSRHKLVVKEDCDTVVNDINADSEYVHPAHLKEDYDCQICGE